MYLTTFNQANHDQKTLRVSKFDDLFVRVEREIIRIPIGTSPLNLGFSVGHLV